MNNKKQYQAPQSQIWRISASSNMMAGSPPSKIVRVDNEDDEITNGFVDAKPIFDLWEDSDKNRDEDSCQ